MRLFCFPHAGGGTALYHRWSGEFPREFDVVPLLLPGRERRLAEPPLSNLEDLATAAADALASCLDKPFAVFGHSLGALLAYETARTLRRRGLLQPMQLFVAAYRAPQLPAKSSPVRNLADADFVKAVQERFGGIPQQIAENAELLTLFLPSLRADFAASETYNYHPEPPLDCPIMALGGVQDGQVSAAELSGWRSHTVAQFSQKMFTGGHFFVSDCSNDVARIVQGRLERCLT
jgi:medium-chain acyl-[acyl-carrier-protein] hydrolase